MEIAADLSDANSKELERASREQNNKDKIMDALLLIGSGMFLAVVLDWCWTFWRNAENRRAKAKAEKVLAAHGMSAHAYLATVGAEEIELRQALDQFAFTGHIVLDRQGNVVGRLLPRVNKGPHLRLVVDNSK